MSCHEEEVLSICAESSSPDGEFEGFEEADLSKALVVTLPVGAEIEVHDSSVKRKTNSRAGAPKKLKSVKSKKSTATSKPRPL